MTGTTQTNNNKRLAVMHDFFGAMEKKSIVYALLHNSTNLANSLNSDFDVIVSEHPLERVLDAIREVCIIHKLRIVNILHYEVPHGYYFILTTNDSIPEYLHIDCLYDPIGINRYLLPTTELILNRKYNGQFYYVDDMDSTLYLLIKRAIKPDITPERIDQLNKQLRPDVIKNLAPRINNFFGNDCMPIIHRLADNDDLKSVEKLLCQLKNTCLRQYFYKHPISFLKKIAYVITRKLGRLAHPSGFFLVIIGPDGCGKTTITKEVKNILTRAYRKHYHFHWRPAVLPKLSNKKPSINSSTTPDCAPPATESKYNGPVSYIRYFYYTLDFIIGYWFRLYPIIAQTTLVIGERYYSDIAVHPQRYGFCIPKWLIHMVGTCIPNPDLIVLLTNTPEIIYSRKTELSTDQISKQLMAYENEIKRWGKSIIIKTDDTPINIASKIANIILEIQSEKTRSRNPL